MLIGQGGIVQDLEENLLRKAEQRFEDFKETLRDTKETLKIPKYRRTDIDQLKELIEGVQDFLNIGVAPAQLITQPDFSYQKFSFSIEYLINF